MCVCVCERERERDCAECCVRDGCYGGGGHSCAVQLAGRVEWDRGMQGTVGACEAQLGHVRHSQGMRGTVGACKVQLGQVRYSQGM